MAEPYWVLLVEDDVEHAQLIKEFLSLDQSYNIDCVDRVRFIWKALSRENYQVILMDYRLPDGNGLDALQELRSRGYDIPVIMVTAQGDESIAVQAIQKGAVDYVVKRGDYMLNLPSVITKAIDSHDLKRSVENSLNRIRYQALILNNVRDAVVVWDIAGNITFWNSAAESLFGWSSVDCLGKHVSELYCPIFTPSLEWPISSLVQHEEERYFVRKDGIRIWISSLMTELRDTDGNSRKLLGYMDVVRDISERKLMEDKFSGAQARLIQSARLAAVGELASGIAHRINNPLTTIIGDAQLILRSLPEDHVTRESAEAIEDAGWKAQKVVQRLIEFSNPAAREQEWIHIDKTIDRAIMFVGAQIQADGIQILLDVNKDLPEIFGDSARLEDLWITLLRYARDQIVDETKQKIIMEASNHKEMLVVKVQIIGLRLSSEELASIFEPDFTGSMNGLGTGVELIICREIVWQHRGQISVGSDKSGTVIKVVIPSRPIDA